MLKSARRMSYKPSEPDPSSDASRDDGDRVSCYVDTSKHVTSALTFLLQSAEDGSQKEPPEAASDTGGKLYCICRRPYDEREFMVGCDDCGNWFHGKCVNLTSMDAALMDHYYCTECRKKKARQQKAQQTPSAAPRVSSAPSSSSLAPPTPSMRASSPVNGTSLAGMATPQTGRTGDEGASASSQVHLALPLHHLSVRVHFLAGVP